MMEDRASRLPERDDAWINARIAPPHGDGMRKLLGAIGTVEDATPFLTRVKGQVVDGPLREDHNVASIYNGTFWGVIRWSRSLGKPKSKALAGGFVFIHEYNLSFDISNPEVQASIGGWVSAGTPWVWDGPNDDESYAVSFMLRGVYRYKNRLAIGSAGVGWEPEDKPWMTKRRRFVVYPASMPDGEFDVIKNGPAIDFGVFEIIRTF
jgi:hypothetical protein